MEVKTYEMDEVQERDLRDALDDVAKERHFVFTQRGEQEMPLVDPQVRRALQHARDTKQRENDAKERAGAMTHFDVCWEEALEAAAEEDLVEAYSEHRQAAAAHVQAMEQCRRLMRAER